MDPNPPHRHPATTHRDPTSRLNQVTTGRYEKSWLGRLCDPRSIQPTRRCRTGLLVLGAAAGVASFLSPCSFSLLVSSLARTLSSNDPKHRCRTRLPGRRLDHRRPRVHGCTAACHRPAAGRYGWRRRAARPQPRKVVDEVVPADSDHPWGRHRRMYDMMTQAFTALVAAAHPTTSLPERPRFVARTEVSPRFLLQIFEALCRDDGHDGSMDQHPSRRPCDPRAVRTIRAR